MKVVVISLKKSTERRKNSQQILNQHNINFEFLDAIDGRVDKHPLLERYNERNFLLNYGRKGVPGEIGCYASHYLAWQRCVDSGEDLLVLEDDFTFFPDFPEALNSSKDLINDYGFIRLETTRKKPQVEIKKQGAFTLFKFLKVPQCLTCYAISPRTAAKLIQASQSFDCPVDVFIRNVAMHKQAIFGLEPYACKPGGLFTSEIGKRTRSESKAFTDRVAIFLRKISNMTSNFYEHLSQVITLKRS